MARDLILGDTPRNWSAGMSEKTRRQMAEDVLADIEAPKLAQTIETETFRNFQKNLRLHATHKLPVPLRKEFGQFLRRWQAFRDEHRGRYSGQDFVALKDMLDENRRFAARLTALETAPADSTPTAAPPPSGPPPAAPSPAASIAGVAGLLGAAIVLATSGRRAPLKNTS